MTCSMMATIEELEAQLEKAREKAFIECSAIAYRYVADPEKWLHPTQPRNEMSKHSEAVMEQTARNISWEIRAELFKRKRKAA